MGYPYFNPPGEQKVTTIERGDYFVATGGIEPDSVTKEYSPRKAKFLKAIKITAWVVGVITFVILGVLVFNDYFTSGVF